MPPSPIGPSIRYGPSWSPAVRAGSSILLERRHVDPRPFTPRLQALLRQLHALGSFEQVPRERIALHYVPQKQFPLHLEGIVEGHLFRHLLPRLKIVERAFDVRIPHRARRGARGLDPA